MARSSAIEDSLLQLLRCSVCLEQVDILKALSCQHTICLTCVQQLTVRNNRFKCPICNKENPVPNGGFDLLPDSLVTKQIADLIKQRSANQSGEPNEKSGEESGTITSNTDTVSGEGKSEEQAGSLEIDLSPRESIFGSGASFGFVPTRSASNSSECAQSKTSTSSPDISPRGKRARKDSGATTPAKDEEQKQIDTSVPKLKKDLWKALEFGKNWQRKATAMVASYTQHMETISEGTEAMKDAIIAYQAKVNLLCQEKLQSLSKGACDHKSEIAEELKEVQPNLDKMGDAFKTGPELLRKLSGKSRSPDAVAKARNNLTELEALKAMICKQRQAENLNTIQEGDSVRFVQFDTDPKEVESFVNGKVTHSSVGIFRKGFTKQGQHWFAEAREAMVIFPEQHDWTGPANSIKKSRTKANMPYKGDKVRVKASVETPHFSWKGVRPKKSRGILREIQHEGPAGELVVLVDFPEEKQWRGLYSELELVPGCGLEPGDEVWVSRSIPEPSRGWAGVNGSSVGKVKSITGSKGSEEVTVDFPECADWIGLATELELVREPQKLDNVQVKLSVTKPQLDWGGVTHQDVGTLTDILYDQTYGKVAQVKFTKRPPWSCMYSELELARYQPPNYDNSGYENDEDEEEGTVDGLALMRMIQMMGMGNMMGQFY